MFRFKEKKKLTSEYIRCIVMNLRDRVNQLEKKVEVLECDHSFQFDHRFIGMFPPWSKYIRMKCTECGERKDTRWEKLSFAERQAYRRLKMVPSDWPMHIKKEDK